MTAPPTEDPGQPQPQRQWHRFRLPIVLAAVVAAVAAAVIVLILVSPDDEPIVNADYVEWTRLRASTPFTVGPEGFIRPGTRRLQFSADGADWSPIDLASWPNDSEASVSELQVLATDARWVVIPSRNDEFEAWSSEDGTSWTRFGLDPEMELVGASRSGFLARSGDDYWHSADMLTWDPIELPFGRREADEARLLAANRGFAFFVGGLREPLETYVTVDGSAWVAGSIDFTDQAPLLEALTIDRVADHWILTGDAQDGDERRLHVWTSPDGAAWQSAGSPDFVRDGMEHGGRWFGFDDLPTIRLSEDDGGERRVVEVWVTKDGLTWERVLNRSNINSFAATANGDGTYTGIYSGSRE